MATKTPKLRKCDCGGKAQFHCQQVDLDVVESFVRCEKCGMETDPWEGPYGMIEPFYDWNQKRDLQPGKIRHE